MGDLRDTVEELRQEAGWTDHQTLCMVLDWVHGRGLGGEVLEYLENTARDEGEARLDSGLGPVVHLEGDWSLGDRRDNDPWSELDDLEIDPWDD